MYDLEKCLPLSYQWNGGVEITWSLYTLVIFPISDNLVAINLLIILGILIFIEYVSDAHDIKNSPQILQQATTPLSSEITIVRLGGPSQLSVTFCAPFSELI